ncbi:hypothetical protein OHV05_35770 (plasmid) [Kitasatospora sp. NBC_00070]|uniref:hypothetical protein n=1 Tax=Kitasatospora sp. NBC_00070 TaxID=2975962 RepID=UPI002F9140DB
MSFREREDCVRVVRGALCAREGEAAAIARVRENLDAYFHTYGVGSGNDWRDLLVENQILPSLLDLIFPDGSEETVGALAKAAADGTDQDAQEVLAGVISHAFQLWSSDYSWPRWNGEAGFWWSLEHSRNGRALRVPGERSRMPARAAWESAARQEDSEPAGRERKGAVAAGAGPERGMTEKFLPGSFEAKVYDLLKKGDWTPGTWREIARKAREEALPALGRETGGTASDRRQLISKEAALVAASNRAIALFVESTLQGLEVDHATVFIQWRKANAMEVKISKAGVLSFIKSNCGPLLADGYTGICTRAEKAVTAAKDLISGIQECMTELQEAQKQLEKTSDPTRAIAALAQRRELAVKVVKKVQGLAGEITEISKAMRKLVSDAAYYYYAMSDSPTETAAGELELVFGGISRVLGKTPLLKPAVGAVSTARQGYRELRRHYSSLAAASKTAEELTEKQFLDLLDHNPLAIAKAISMETKARIAIAFSALDTFIAVGDPSGLAGYLTSLTPLVKTALTEIVDQQMMAAVEAAKLPAGKAEATTASSADATAARMEKAFVRANITIQAQALAAVNTCILDTSQQKIAEALAGRGVSLTLSSHPGEALRKHALTVIMKVVVAAFPQKPAQAVSGAELLKTLDGFSKPLSPPTSPRRKAPREVSGWPVLREDLTKYDITGERPYVAVLVAGSRLWGYVTEQSGGPPVLQFDRPDPTSSIRPDYCASIVLERWGYRETTGKKVKGTWYRNFKDHYTLVTAKSGDYMYFAAGTRVANGRSSTVGSVLGEFGLETELAFPSARSG